MVVKAAPKYWETFEQVNFFSKGIDELEQSRSDAIRRTAANGCGWLELENARIFTGHQLTIGLGEPVVNPCIQVSGEIQYLFGETQTLSISEFGENLGANFTRTDDSAYWVWHGALPYFEIFGQLYMEDNPHYHEKMQIYEGRTEYNGKERTIFVGVNYDGNITPNSLCSVKE